MSSNLAFGFLAGTLTTLSPCVLPLLPVLLGGAVQQHRLAPLALASGLAVSFTAVGLFVASLGFALDIDAGAIRVSAAVIMAAFGVVMLSPALQTVFARIAAPVTGGANGALARVSGDGLGGQFLLGLPGRIKYLRLFLSLSSYNLSLIAATNSSSPSFFSADIGYIFFLIAFLNLPRFFCAPSKSILLATIIWGFWVSFGL